MGVDLLALPGLALELLVWLGYSYAYVRFLDWLAQRRGVLFFWPGFLTGVLGVVVLSTLLQYSRAAAGGITFSEVSISGAIWWSIAPAITASWLASRSTRKALRVSTATGTPKTHIWRALGAFWIGMCIVLLILLVQNISRFAHE